MTDSDDLQWSSYARASRDALAQLGYPTPSCLPDEPDACGGDWAGHVAGYLAAIKAVVDHQLEHLGPPTVMVNSIYENVQADLCARTTTA